MLEGLDWLEGLEGLEGLERLDWLDWLDRLEGLERLDRLDYPVSSSRKMHERHNNKQRSYGNKQLFSTKVGVGSDDLCLRG